MQPNKSGHLLVDDRPRDTGGHHIYWAEYGNPDSSNVWLILHGGYGHTFDMAKMTAFTGQRDIRIIDFHQRGLGYSTPCGEYRYNTVRDNIDDIVRLKEHLDIQKWGLFSWSLGAFFMAAHAYENPSACAALISYAPTFGTEDDYQVAEHKAPEQAGLHKDFHNAATGADIARSTYDKATTGDFWTRFEMYYQAMAIWQPDLAREDLYKSKTQQEWENFFQAYRIGAQIEYALINRYQDFLQNKASHNNLKAPVTLIFGDKDNWSDFNTTMDKILPESRIVRAADVDHDVHDPKAQRVIARQLQRNTPYRPFPSI